MSNKFHFAVVSLLAVAVGCRPSPPEVATSPAANPRVESNAATSEVPLAVADTRQPDAVVVAFLDALRDGNDEVAEALLTTVARRETKQHELAVQPPGSPSARYEIGEVKHVQGGVHVNSIWSEIDSSGEQIVSEIVWVLREEPLGWRVAGMATAMNPGQSPVYLNFEDVPDLLQKWQQLADAESAAQAGQGESLQATQPDNTLRR